MKIVVSGASSPLWASFVPLLSETGHTLLLVLEDEYELDAIHSGTTVASCSNWESLAVGFDIFIRLGLSEAVESGSYRHSMSAKRQSDWIGSLALKARKLGMTRFLYFSTAESLLPGRDSLAGISNRPREQSAKAKLGGFMETIYVGRLHGSKGAGKLSVAESLSQRLFPLFSALKPTTSFNLVSRYLMDPKPSRLLPFVVLTDRKSEIFGYRVWRAFIDSFFVIAVISLFPGLAIAWLAVVLEDGRPGFFSQERVGLEGLVFRCIKLRTMRKGTVSKGTHRVDPQAITRVGQSLRRLKIDEFPQAWNILRKEMSLIGPRPCLLNQHDVVDARNVWGIFDVRPGLTGWAQANGVDMRDSEKLARYDAEYVGLQSVWFDFLILKKTLFGNSDSRKQSSN